MDAALIGAAAALLGSVLTTLMQHRHEREGWQRDRQQAAYDGALRHLLKVAHRRGELVAKTGRVLSVLAKDQVPQMFDDLIEAQFWLRSLVSSCGPSQVARLSQAADSLDAGAFSLTHDQGDAKLDVLATIKIVTECAREDIGRLPVQLPRNAAA
ncbi:hypothetical protein [Streptomyces chartreusis]